MKSDITANNKAVISSKGQVVIPKALREQWGVHARNELFFKLRPDGVMEVKTVRRTIDMFFGRCKQDNKEAVSIGDIDKSIMKAVKNGL